MCSLLCSTAAVVSPALQPGYPGYTQPSFTRAKAHQPHNPGLQIIAIHKHEFVVWA